MPTRRCTRTNPWPTACSPPPWRRRPSAPSRATANVGNLLVTGSTQFDVGDRVRLGAIVTAPGVRVTGSSRVTYQNSVFRGAESRDIAFRDDEMTFDYKPPLLAGVGVAGRFGRAEVEVDVRYHGSRDAYVLFSSEV